MEGTLYSTSPWWADEDERSMGLNLANLVSRLWELDSTRRSDIEANYRRFSGMQPSAPLSNPTPEALLARARRPLRLNVVKSVVETIVAKVGKNRPRPMLLTDGADHGLQVRVRELQKFVDGAYQQAEVYNRVPIVFRDAMIAGTGVLHFYGSKAKGGRIMCERAFPTEMVVDPKEAINGDPQTLYRVKYADKYLLTRLMPNRKHDILALQTVSVSDLPDYQRSDTEISSSMVRVVEAWQLASYDHEGNLVPGRHVILGDTTVLHSEEWCHDFFPFEFFHWTAPVSGFWGESAVSEVIPVDSEVNTLLQQIQAAMRLTANPWVLLNIGSKVKAGELTNQVGQIVWYEGSPPVIQSFQPIHPQVIQHLWGLFAKAYEILGSNEMAASAVKPPGVESGRALEQLSEEHLVRFETQSRHLEDVVGVRSCRQVLRVAKELDECIEGGFVLRSTSKKTALRIKWAEASMTPEDFFVQCFPTSILPALPSGRTEEVERWQAAGWIDQATAQQLLDFPDLDKAGDVMRADADLLDKQIDGMVFDARDEMPDERQNLERAGQKVTFAYLRAVHDGKPESVLRRLRNYLNALDEIVQANADEAPGMPGELPVDPLTAQAGGIAPGPVPPGPALPPGAPMMPPGPGGMPMA